MTQIKIITPPDIIYDRARTMVLIHPSESIKVDIQNILNNSTIDYSIYLYDINTIEHTDWLLAVHKMCDICIVDLDCLPIELKCIESYFISYPNTFYMTQGENQLYNKISNNRIHLIEEIKHIIGTHGKI
jgi:hypothetical protein